MSTVQFCNLSMSSCRLVVHELCSSYKAACIFVSSAKSEQKLFIVDGMLLTNSVKNNGPNTDPWGTTLVTRAHEDSAEFTTTLCFLPVRNALIHANRFSANTKCLNLISKSDVWYCIKCFSIVEEYYIHWYVVTQSF